MKVNFTNGKEPNGVSSKNEKADFISALATPDMAVPIVSTPQNASSVLELDKQARLLLEELREIENLLNSQGIHFPMKEGIETGKAKLEEALKNQKEPDLKNAILELSHIMDSARSLIK